MKTKVIETICKLDDLNREINYFEAISISHPYLIMNKNTAEFIFKETFNNKNFEVIGKIKSYNDGIIASYNGYKIFIDDDLEFGTVDIR